MKAISMRLAKNKKTLILLSMMLPGAIWLLLLRYLPMFGVVLAFKKFTIRGGDLLESISKSPWVGIDNFKFMFSSSDAIKMIRNTLGYNALWIVLTLIVSVILAILLNEITRKHMAKVYQTLMFFPYFLSWIVVSYFVFAFFAPNDGLLVHLQTSLGQKPMDWYNNPKWWPLILTISSLWKNVGYSCILYLAAITGIDATQYEAASIDGATKLQQIWYVTIPHIRPMIIILFIMNVGRIFNSDFGLFWSVPMNSGPLISVTQTIDTYVYRVMQNMHNIGMSSAAGLLQSIVGCICVVGANQIVRKVDPESSLF